VHGVVEVPQRLRLSRRRPLKFRASLFDDAVALRKFRLRRQWKRLPSHRLLAPELSTKLPRRRRQLRPQLRQRPPLLLHRNRLLKNRQLSLRLLQRTVRLRSHKLQLQRVHRLRLRKRRRHLRHKQLKRRRLRNHRRRSSASALVRVRSFQAHRALVQSRQALRSLRLARLHRLHLVPQQDFLAHDAKSAAAVVAADPTTAAVAVERRDVAVLSIRKRCHRAFHARCPRFAAQPWQNAQAAELMMAAARKLKRNARLRLSVSEKLFA
jgi:hypothetical protein